MIVNKVQKKAVMDIWNIVKFQISIYCHLNSIHLSNLDLDCITLLAIEGEIELNSFCVLATEKKIFGSSQSVRNALTKVEKKKLIVKTGKSKKQISINPSLNIQTSGNILLDYKIVRITPKED